MFYFSDDSPVFFSFALHSLHFATSLSFCYCNSELLHCVCFVVVAVASVFMCRTHPDSFMPVSSSTVSSCNERCFFSFEIQHGILDSILKIFNLKPEKRHHQLKWRCMKMPWLLPVNEPNIYLKLPLMPNVSRAILTYFSHTAQQSHWV